MKTIMIRIPTLHSEVEFERIERRKFRASFGDYDGFGTSRAEAFNDLLNNFPSSGWRAEHEFPNGFNNWHETHYFISIHVDQTEEVEGTLAFRRRERQGMGALWELAEELTNEFERLHEGRAWDGEWMDELEQWLISKNAQEKSPLVISTVTKPWLSKTNVKILDALEGLYGAIVNHATVEVLDDPAISKYMEESLKVMQRFDPNRTKSHEVF